MVEEEKVAAVLVGLVVLPPECEICNLLHIPHICHFFTQAKFLENKIYTEKRQFSS